MELKLRRGVLDLSEPKVMGVLNVTPDSFSDGGHFATKDQAIRHAENMLASGATIIDVGGESTRPGARPVTEQEELDRVCPVIEAVKAELGCLISLDTSTPAVMREGVRLGAEIINDVRGLERPGALEMAAGLEVPVCLMHMQGEPATMQNNPHYEDPLSSIKEYLAGRVKLAEAAGIERARLFIDPGFGFGKRLQDNLALLARLQEFEALKLPLLVGLSRKSMLGQVTGKEVGQRLAASVAAAAIAVYNGAAIVRAHDVADTVDAIKVAAAARGEK